MVLTDAWRVLVVVGLFIAAGLLARRGAIWPLTGLLFMLVAIFPASNIAIPIGILRADRVMFLPSLGYAIIFGWLIDLIARRQRTAALVLLTVVTLALGVRSAVRSLDWKSSETLVRTTVRDNPGAAPAWSYLAAIHRDAGRNEEAMEGFRRASELYGGVMQTPRMQERYAISRFNYAMAMLGSDRAQATAMLESIVEGETQLYEAFMNLGGVRFEDGDTEGAIAMFRRAIATEPDRFEAHGNLAVVLASDGRRDEAIAALREMMRREAPAELVRQIEATVQELAPAP